MKLVKVIWKDARTLDGTYTKSELENFDLALCHTIGYLIKEEKDKVIVVSYCFISDSLDYQDGFRYTHIIPKKCIIKIIKLKEIS